MSRIGKKPIEIPAGVTVTVSDGVAVVKGPKGELSQEIRPEIEVKVKDSTVTTSIKEESKSSSAFWGLTRALLANMIRGVAEGFEKRLQMIGVGYRVKKVSDSKISMTVGFSHPVEFEAPKEITLDVEGNDIIIVRGFDKQLVGLTAAQIRKIKKPEPYKGKGIRYMGEIVKRKPGKAGRVL
jgi:large subunit ribosomal protein L6